VKETIGLIAVALAIIGHIPYIYDIYKGKTKPHIFTWVVWAIVTVLAFIANGKKVVAQELGRRE